MKILITGASGTIGSVLLKCLSKKHDVVGVDKIPSNNVVTLDIGNVTNDNNFGEYPFWLSHRDCCQFIERCIETDGLPKYSVFFAVSDNPCNPFDLSDARLQLGYEPRDKSECPDLK